MTHVSAFVVLALIAQNARAAEEISATSGTAPSRTVAKDAKSGSAKKKEASSYNPSSSMRGTLGVHRVEAAHPLPAGDLVLTIGGTYSMADSFLVAGDHNTYQTQHLLVTWAFPWLEGLEFNLAQHHKSNDNDQFVPRSTQSVGDPELGVKFSYPFFDMFGAGAMVSFMLPTSPLGTGLKPEAFRLTLLGAFTVAPVKYVEISLNVGYVIDETSKLFARTLDPAKQFAADVAYSNLFIAGLGVASNINVMDVVGLGPFAEFHMGLASGAGGNENPIRTTLGAKVYPANRGLLELALGVDLRITGQPQTGKMPGIPPWEVFARVTAHVFATRSVVSEGGPLLQSCTIDADCPKGQGCLDVGQCAVIKEVVKTEVKEVVKTETKEVVKVQPTFRIEGKVVNKDSGLPIPDASVGFSDGDASSLAVDPKTGAFRSFPIPVGEGIVKVKAQAEDFMPAEDTVPRGQAGESKTIEFRLQRIGKAMVGEVRGNLKDARTGKPVKGVVFIPKLGKKIPVDAQGQFKATLKAGVYNVLVSSKGYITQKKDIEIFAGDVVIFNLDLSAKGN